jgi:AcrR family transcriptional regulator
MSAAEPTTAARVSLFEQDRPSPREAVRLAQQQQLMQAMLETVAAKGFAATTITEVVKAARVSTRTFYELYADKEDCFLAAYDIGVDFLAGRIVAAVDAVDPPERPALIRAGLEAYLSTLAGEPDLARVLLVEVMGAGRRGWERREQTIDRWVTVFRQAVARARESDASVRLADQESGIAFVGAIEELARSELRRGEKADLRRVLPHALRTAGVGSGIGG